MQNNKYWCVLCRNQHPKPEIWFTITRMQPNKLLYHNSLNIQHIEVPNITQYTSKIKNLKPYSLFHP